MVYRGTGDTTAQAAFGVWITNRQYRAAIINCATTDIELRRTWSMATVSHSGPKCPAPQYVTQQ
jgi:hypothetical protein